MAKKKQQKQSMAVRGNPADHLESRLRLPDGAAAVSKAFDISLSARAEETPLTSKVSPDDVVEVELEDGTVFWTRLDQLVEDTQKTGLTQRGDNTLPTHFPAPDSSDRGLLGIAIKTLKFLDIEVADETAGKAIRKVAENVESGLAQPVGFHRVDASGNLKPGAIEPGSEPVLVFIHGTASSSLGGFGDLFQGDEQRAAWASLLEYYDGRIFAFEHPTLTRYPVQNAVDFVAALPPANVPPLHLVSHSRGGLVGELVAHGGLGGVAFPAADLEAAGIQPLQQGDAPDQYQAFLELNELLEQKSPRVERFVRVGCPAAGTTLASGRLDIYLSVMFNLLGKIPAAGPLLGVFGDLVAHAAKLRADPRVLPGLAAQMPESGFIRLLNSGQHKLSSELTVIAGDSDGLLKNLANLFYWQANDLVVDTRSMFRGAAREKRYWYRAEGVEVHHCNYFSRAETVSKLVEGLTRPDPESSGFQLTVPRSETRGSVPAAEPEDALDRPAVILVPGVMGSNLSVPTKHSRNRVWLDISDLMRGRMDQLRIDAEAVQADTVIDSAYADFAAYLREQGQHVIPFPYDWRRSIAQAAGELQALIQRRLDAGSDQPVRIVAHSMGGLVARHFIANCRGQAPEANTWDLLVRGGGRLIQVGTPNGGSYLIPYLLKGREKLLKMLAAIDLRNSREDWIELVGRFPGLLEMAPQAADRDYFQSATWDALDVHRSPNGADLAAAKAVVDAIRSVDLKDHPVLYVAGKSDETPFLAPGKSEFSFTPDGDGRVTWKSGIPEGIEPWYIDAKHGSLCDHAAAFPGLLDLITRGTTQRLSRKPPATRGVQRPGSVLATDAIDVFPDQEALERAALGMDDPMPSGRTTTAEPQCTLRVVHGDLSYARFPVMCGHYAGDPIIHAEKALDSRLGHYLSRRQQLRLYPGPIGTHEIVLRGSQSEPGGRGALIVGLGEPGELTPGRLARTIEDALVRYAIQADSEETLGVSTLLIGSGDTGFTLRMVIEALLGSVRLANRRLGKVASGVGRIGEVDIIELYEDRALQALHVLLESEPSTLRGFSVEHNLKRSTGGRLRASFREAPGWWAPVSIVRSKVEDSLNFITSDNRSRAPEATLQLQGQLVHQLLKNPLSREGRNQELRHALFELLLPNTFKQSAADGNNMLVVLDDYAAQFPWEMMADRRSREGLPMSVKAGMIRKLRVDKPSDVSHPEVNRALVVGDPPSRLPELKGAQSEARAVVEKLQSDKQWTVVRQIRKDVASEKYKGSEEIDARSVISALLNDDFRILHLAGHGVYRQDQPERSGMVIGDHPDGKDFLLISPAEIEQMRLLPELVFINCCHLGRVQDTPPHLLAANLSTAFIRRGVKAVVAAGWAVGDRAATTFAHKFYEQMFNGNTFGDAVLAARRAVYDGSTGGNTWAAYQCYGDPGFSLMMDTGVRQARQEGYWHSVVDPREIVVELGNLHASARSQTGEAGRSANAERIRSHLESLDEWVGQRGWSRNAEIVLGIARVYAEIGFFDRATDYLERALSAEEGAVTLKDLEQLATLRSHHALAEYRRASAGSAKAPNPARAIEAIARSIAEIKRLLQLAPTLERWSLLASCHKDMAWVTAGQTRADHLAHMTDCYDRAAGLPSNTTYALYPQTNALAGILLLGGPWRNRSARPRQLRDRAIARPGGFGDALSTALEQAQELSFDSHDFWTLAFEPDLKLLAALHGNTLAPGKAAVSGAPGYEQVLGAYIALFEHGSTREQGSVLRQFDAMIEFLATAPGSSAAATRRRQQVRALQKLQDDLT